MLDACSRGARIDAKGHRSQDGRVTRGSATGPSGGPGEAHVFDRKQTDEAVRRAGGIRTGTVAPPFLLKRLPLPAAIDEVEPASLNRVHPERIGRRVEPCPGVEVSGDVLAAAPRLHPTSGSRQLRTRIALREPSADPSSFSEPHRGEPPTATPCRPSGAKDRRFDSCRAHLRKPLVAPILKGPTKKDRKNARTLPSRSFGLLTIREPAGVVGACTSRSGRPPTRTLRRSVTS
jgi:hypothetical protein